VYVICCKNRNQVLEFRQKTKRINNKLNLIPLDVVVVRKGNAESKKTKINLQHLK
jgi:hypothetical protein